MLAFTLSRAAGRLFSQLPRSAMALPKLVALDLDGTVWYPDMYMLWGGGGAPFRADGDGTSSLTDCGGNKVELMGIAGEIIYQVKKDPKWVSNGTKLAWCSTTDEPTWAQECLRKFKAKGSSGPAISLKELADSEQIYKARTKREHFNRLKAEFGIAFEDMIFYDNQMNNIHDVSPLGVHCVYAPDGLTRKKWEQGLADFAKKRK